MSKTDGFCAIFFGRVPLSGKTRVECQKLGFFCVFGGPETVLKTVLTIRFASYGRFFERSKMSENCQKTSKTGGFWRFFRIRSNSLPESGCRVSNRFFLQFWCARICAHDSFCHTALSRPCPEVKRGGFRLVRNQSETDLVVSDWFQRGLKLASFLKKAPKRPFFLSAAIPSGPVMVSEGFQNGIRVVSEGSETVWFQRV